jgi:hypothetical protein
LEWKKVGILYGPLEYISAIWYILWQFGNLVAVWYISPRYGILNKEQSGNTVRIQGDQKRLWKSRTKCSPIHFLWKLIYNFYRGKKSSLIICAASVIFTKTTQSEQSPNRRKFAQSGHPVRNSTLVDLTFLKLIQLLIICISRVFNWGWKSQALE